MSKRLHVSIRFSAGDAGYAKDGARYIVEEVEDGIVYCTAPNGVETEFPEAALATETEWAARTDGRRDTVYGRLRQSSVYTGTVPRVDPHAAELALTKFERACPGILDFTAFSAATWFLTEHHETPLLHSLSIVKCREIFDAARPEIRLGLLARLLSQQVVALAGASPLGDNLTKAILDKGMAEHAAAFDEFCDRPRN